MQKSRQKHHTLTIVLFSFSLVDGQSRLVSNYALMVTNKSTETRLRGIKQNKVEIIPLSLVSVFGFVCIGAQFETKIYIVFFLCNSELAYCEFKES